LTSLPDPSHRAAFLATVQGKLISGLAIIALVLGITAEGLTIYRQALGAMIDRETLDKVTAETAIIKQKSEVLTARIPDPSTRKEMIAQACAEFPNMTGCKK